MDERESLMAKVTQRSAQLTPNSEPTSTLSPSEYEEWETLTSELGDRIRFTTVGQVVVGRYEGTSEVSIVDDDGAEATRTAMILLTGDGKIHFFPPYQIRELLSNLNIGDMVRIEYIEYKGDSPTKRGLNPVKRFTVKRRPAN